MLRVYQQVVKIYYRCYYKIVVKFRDIYIIRSRLDLITGGDWYIKKEGDMTFWASQVSCNSKYCEKVVGRSLINVQKEE